MVYVAKDWKVSSEVKDIVHELSRKFISILSGVNPDEVSCIIAMDGKAPNKGQTLSKIRKVNNKTQAATGTTFNFIIEVYADNWFGLSETQKQWVILHELLHIDPNSEDPKLRKHDVEDFSAILKTYGVDYIDSDLPNLLDDEKSESDYDIDVTSFSSDSE
jgi:predicted metallopeptidase